MRIRAILSDLDGTLLNHQHKFSDFTKAIVQQSQKEGLHFIIATGRHHKDVQGLLEKLAISTLIITSNGARIHNERGKLLFEENLDSQIAKKILMTFPYEKYPNIRVNAYQNEEWISSLPSTTELEYHYNQTNFKSRMENLKELKSYENIIKIFFNTEPISDFENTDSQSLSEIQTELSRIHGNDIILTAGLKTVIEVNSPKATKGQAMQKFASMKGLKLDEIVAFGDGYNDYDMLKTAGKGILMANAPQSLKEDLSELTIIGSCNDDSVARYIKNHVLQTSKK